MPLVTGPLRGMATAALALALAVTVAGCSGLPSADGDWQAARAAERIADDIAAHSENVPRITVPEMIAWWIPQSPTPAEPGMAIVEPLAWSGESAGSQATIDIRVDVDVEAHSSAQIFGKSWSAGSATRCFRLEWVRYEPARRSEIACPEGPAPARPQPAARPDLTQADQDRVAAILVGHTTAADAAGALREAFPEEYVTVETDEADDGVVAAVGIPAELECILALRDSTGAVTFPSFRRVSLEPGEIGCSTELYTDPPF
nr:hypothetical protein GCM10025699_12330 [Microbacterium flavescens]